MSIASAGGDLNLDNATLDYGDMVLANYDGNINIKSSIKGKSLDIFTGRAFEQSNGADINMTDNFSVTAGEKITQNSNITAGEKIDIHSEGGVITQAQSKHTVAKEVNYEGRILNIDGDINAYQLGLATNKLIQGNQSSLSAKNTVLYGGDFNLTSGGNNLGEISVGANSLKLNANATTTIANNSYVRNMDINSTGDVILGTLAVDGKTNITANNINSTLELTGDNNIYGGSEITLNAKNNINLRGIEAGDESYWWGDFRTNVSLSGNNIDVDKITASGDVRVTAGNNIQLGYVGSERNVNISAKNDIHADNVFGRRAVKATSTAGSITFGTLYKTSNKDLKAAKGVHIDNDENAHSWWWPFW